MKMFSLEPGFTFVSTDTRGLLLREVSQDVREPQPSSRETRSDTRRREKKSCHHNDSMSSKFHYYSILNPFMF
jgi:hypothetical protein